MLINNDLLNVVIVKVTPVDLVVVVNLFAGIVNLGGVNGNIIFMNPVV